MELLWGGLVLILHVVFVSAVGQNDSILLCSECFHVTFSSKDSRAIIPEDTINKDCLKTGEDYTHPDYLECEPGVAYCRKVVGTAKMIYKGYEIIADINSRECGAEGNDTICRNDDYYISNIFETKGATNVRVDAQACFCDWDKCNHGDRMQSATLPVILALVVWRLTLVCKG